MIGIGEEQVEKFFHGRFLARLVLKGKSSQGLFCLAWFSTDRMRPCTGGIANELKNPGRNLFGREHFNRVDHGLQPWVGAVGARFVYHFRGREPRADAGDPDLMAFFQTRAGFREMDHASFGGGIDGLWW